MIPKTIEDLEKIEWSFVYTLSNTYILCGYYEGEIHYYFTNEMYLVSSVPGNYLALANNLIKELNNYWEKDLPFFDSVDLFVKYINRNKIINSILDD
jgi:hypothetical protein